ncbi:hypothetical protein DFH28DRAFT_310631 [Melampsora americana]|nr:hypothetical protein DFH28DRAFT_310631 [Melampsora americana]
MSSFQHRDSSQEEEFQSTISEYYLNSQDEPLLAKEIDDNITEYHSLTDHQNHLSYDSQSDSTSASLGFLGVDFDGEDNDWFDRESATKYSNFHHGKNSDTSLDQIPLDLLPPAPLLRPQAIHQTINFSPLWLNSDSPSSVILSPSKTPVPSYKQGQLPTISYPFEPPISTQSSRARPSCMSVTSTNSTITPHTEHACPSSTLNSEQSCLDSASPALVSEKQEISLPLGEIACGEVQTNESYADPSVLLSLVVPHSSAERPNRNSSSSHTVQPESISRLILHDPSLTSTSSSSANIFTSNHPESSRTQQLGRLLPPVKIHTTYSLPHHNPQSLSLGASVPSPPDTSFSIDGQSLFSPSPPESSTTISLHSIKSESDNIGLIPSISPDSMDSHDSRPMKKSSRSFFPYSETFPSTLSPSSAKIAQPSMVTGMMNHSQVDEEMNEVLDFNNFQIPECYNDFVFSEPDHISPAVIKRSASQSNRQPSTHAKTLLPHVKSLDLSSRNKIPSLFSLSKLKSRESPSKIPMSLRNSMDSQVKKPILYRDSVGSVVDKPVPSRSRSLQLMNNADASLQNATQNIYPQYGMESEDDEEELSRWFDIADDVISQSHQSILERNRAFVRDLKLPELGDSRTNSNAPTLIRQSSESEGYVYGPTTSNVLEGFSKESSKVRVHSRIGLRQMDRSRSPTDSHSSHLHESKPSITQNVISSLFQTLRIKKQPTQTTNPIGLSPNSIPSCSNSSHYSVSSSSTSISSLSPVNHSPHAILLDHGDRSQPPKRPVCRSEIEPSNNLIRSGSIHKGGNSFALESSKNLQQAILNKQYQHPNFNSTNSNSHLIHPCRASNSRHASKHSLTSLGLDLTR